jgi:hypothetical protein
MNIKVDTFIGFCVCHTDLFCDAWRGDMRFTISISDIQKYNFIDKMLSNENK